MSERLNILRSNNKILDEIIPSLRTKEVNLNLYVDANHLKVSIDYGLPEIQENCQKIWDYFNKGQFPKLNLDKDAYGHLSGYIMSKFLYKFERTHCLNSRDKTIEELIDTGQLVSKISLRRLYEWDKKITKEDIYRNFKEKLELL